MGLTNMHSIFYLIFYTLIIVLICLFAFFLYSNRESKKHKSITHSTSRSDLRALIIALVFLIIGLFLIFQSYELHEKDKDSMAAHFLRDFGLICVAIALVDFVQKFFMHTHFRKEVIDEIKNIAPLYESHHRHGILDVSDRMPDLNELINETDKVVILQTYIPSLENFKNSIVEAFKNNKNFEINIYLLKPDSTFTNCRSEVIASSPEQDLDIEHIKENISNNKRILKSIYQLLTLDQKKRMKLFEYDLLPAASIYRFDNFAYIGFYVYGSLAVITPQLKVTWGQGIGLKFKEHLKYLKEYPNHKVQEIDLGTGSPKLNAPSATLQST